MDDGDHRVGIVIGAVAAAAGIALISYLIVGRHRRSSEPAARSVSEVLTDSYAKIREIQQSLADLHPSGFQTSHS